MKKRVYLFVALAVSVITVAVLAFVLLSNPKLSDKEFSCVNSGGKVSTSLCCGSAGDFPNLCTIGACGCSPTNSHEVKICDCGEGMCFNGSSCVTSTFG